LLVDVSNFSPNPDWYTSFEAALIFLSFDLIVGTNFFNPAGGGDPIVYQHMFWFYSHPAVYIMVLPYFGIISEVLPVHARKPIFAYRAIAYSNLAISFLGLLVWAHHMFTSGTPVGCGCFSWQRACSLLCLPELKSLAGVPRFGAASSA
jgi:heme/copper-type cytochrome/quinol oxidase subunit 1